MCDFGRDLYRFCNHEYRLFQAKKREPDGILNLPVKDALSSLKTSLDQNSNKDKIALVLTGQYTLEEYQAVISAFKTKSTQIFHWINNKETFDEFDGFLIRGDKNPNTNGLVQVLKENDIQSSWKELESKLSQGEIDVLFVCGPENLDAYPDLDQKLQFFSQVSKVIWMTSVKHPSFEKENGPTDWIPTKSFVEKSGTFVNFEGRHQSFKSITQIVPQALDLIEIFSELGFSISNSSVLKDKSSKAENFSVCNETFVKNEFTIERENR